MDDERRRRMLVFLVEKELELLRDVDPADFPDLVAITDQGILSKLRELDALRPPGSRPD